ncbi:MAG: HEAT repeat domain-containing protein [Myxococcales bacterium]|nr:HEAT repeat domain-containing protein [Myxococcales bacterium]
MLVAPPKPVPNTKEKPVDCLRTNFSSFLLFCWAISTLTGCVPQVIRPNQGSSLKPASRMFALYALEEQPKPLSSAQIRLVAQSLTDSNARIRYQALRTLDTHPTPRKISISFQLDQTLHVIARSDTYTPARRLAIKLLATLDLPEEESLRTLEQIWQQTRSEQAKAWATGSMCALQGGKSEACKRLCAALQHKVWAVRREAVRIQGLLHYTPAKCPLGVSKALQDPMIIVRYNAAFALGALPTQSSQETQKALHKALLDLREPVLLTSAAYALCKKKVQKGCDLLLELMQHKNGYIRLQASRALLRLRQDAAPLLPALQRLLVHPETLVALQAAYVMCRFDQCDLPLDTLLRALKSDNKKHKMHAQITLQRLAHRAVPALLAALPESPPPLQKRIIQILGRMRWRATKALPTLQKMQRSKKLPKPLQLPLKATLRMIAAKP